MRVCPPAVPDAAQSDGHACARDWVLQCPSVPAKWHLCKEQLASSCNLQAAHKPNSCLLCFSFTCRPQDLIYELKAVASSLTRSELSSWKQDDAHKRIVPHWPLAPRPEVPRLSSLRKFWGSCSLALALVARVCAHASPKVYVYICVYVRCFAASTVCSSVTNVFNTAIIQGSQLPAILEVSC